MDILLVRVEPSLVSVKGRLALSEWGRFGLAEGIFLRKLAMVGSHESLFKQSSTSFRAGVSIFAKLDKPRGRESF